MPPHKLKCGDGSKKWMTATRAGTGEMWHSRGAHARSSSLGDRKSRWEKYEPGWRRRAWSALASAEFPWRPAPAMPRNGTRKSHTVAAFLVSMVDVSFRLLSWFCCDSGGLASVVPLLILCVSFLVCGCLKNQRATSTTARSSSSVRWLFITPTTARLGHH